MGGRFLAGYLHRKYAALSLIEEIPPGHGLVYTGAVLAVAAAVVSRQVEAGWEPPPAVLRAVADIAAADGTTPDDAHLPPLAVLRATAIIEDEARAERNTSVQAAREAGHTWAEIGEALGYSGPGAADDAYRVIAVIPERFPEWFCRACGRHVQDAGPRHAARRRRDRARRRVHAAGRRGRRTAAGNGSSVRPRHSRYPGGDQLAHTSRL